MRPTRKIIAEFIAVFLIGAIAGGLVTWSYTDTQLTSFMSKTADKPDAMVARINKKYIDDYHLTPDELTKIQPTVTAMAQNIYSVRHQFGVDILATLDKYHDQIAGQLTPEHRDVYERAIAERHKKLTTILLLDQSSPTDASK
jgi:uncharacterized membrane protein